MTIIELRNKLKEDLELVQKVCDRLGLEASVVIAPKQSEPEARSMKRVERARPPRHAKPLQGASFNLSRRPPAGAFSTEVRRAIVAMGGVSFSSAEIQEYLEKHAAEALKTAGKSSLGSTLSRLVATEELNSLERANGRARYRARKGFVVGDGISDKERAYQAERATMNIQVPRDDDAGKE